MYAIGAVVMQYYHRIYVLYIQPTHTIMEKDALTKLSQLIYDDADVYRNDENPDYHMFSTPEKIVAHINKVLEPERLNVESFNVIAMGITHPYNDSDPYSYDTISIRLNDGTVFTVVHRYGRPLWSGNVLYCNSISVMK